MSALTVRNLNDSTKQGLRIRAARRGASMEDEVRSILRLVVEGDLSLDDLAAGKKAGLVDVKVVSFSETHTAEKFVIPRGDRV